MTDQTVAELTGYRATAAELRRIADAVEHLELNREVPYVTVSFLPSAADATPDEQIADVNTVAQAVLGYDGKRDEHSNGIWQTARGDRSGVYVNVTERLGDSEPDTGLAYSRPADDPTPVSGARVEPHVGAVTETGLVDETEPCRDKVSGLHRDPCTCPPWRGREYFEDGNSNAECSDEELEGR